MEKTFKPLWADTGLCLPSWPAGGPVTVPLADYYIIAGVVYQAPDLGSVIGSRVVRITHTHMHEPTHTMGIGRCVCVCV